MKAQKLRLMIKRNTMDPWKICQVSLIEKEKKHQKNGGKKKTRRKGRTKKKTKTRKK